MAAITSAGLKAAFPEWELAADAVLDPVILKVNAIAFDLYTDDDQDTYRRYQEASAVLYDQAFSRPMDKPDQATSNPYRRAASRDDLLKATAYRAPGWTLPAGL